MKIISTDKISKYYLIQENKFEKIKDIFFKSSENKKFYAVSDISFEIKKGEHLGIIGDNGSGKSTLLKILSGITLPSSGSYDVKGKIFSILELGLGFNDNFSGRENIELSYSLYGIKKKNLKNYLQNIIKFSELGIFFERPVRTYSNGMRLRLAFAAAIFSNPDILIIDEALAVGDIDFQKKCFDKINELKDKGTTLIYVSHDLNSVKSICTKAILLSKGKIIAYGYADDVCNIYLKKNFRNTNISNKNKYSLSNEVSDKENYEKRMIKKIFLSNAETERDTFLLNEDIDVNIEILFLKKVSPTIGIMIKNKIGVEIFGINSNHLKIDLNFEENETKLFKFKIKNFLTSGVYFLNCGIFEKNKNNFLQRNINNIKFEIINNKYDASTSIAGFLNIPTKLEIIDKN